MKNEDDKKLIKKKKLKIIGIILLAEFALCLILAVINAVIGIEASGSWISWSFNGFSAFALTMLIGTIIIAVSNLAILILYEMVCLIFRLYKSQKKGFAVLIALVLIILLCFFVNWLMWI